jgi:Reverse transcriptase (RNA-dependent DNA polymerase)
LKCKARLVVRGDQQAKSELETYAATLAARSFRTFMAIAARFDLELKQYDAVNAFVHAPLDCQVYMRMPPGYRERGKIYRLNKAAYGLRKSPLLWQRTFTATLLEIGFKPVPHEPCCLTCDGILIFFYVDDIVLAYRKSQEPKARDLMSQLKQRYNLSGGEDLQWFLGIEVHRDRGRRLIWLSQSSYIDKIAKLADTHQPNETPMAKVELFPYEGRASREAVRSYQRKIGSMLYAAVTTRIDIAFAVSRLARFLTNPSPGHHAAADRVLHYLYRYRGLGLQLGGADDFLVATDASFADNTLDRKSSQAYVMVLFGGVVGWRANKQNTVTTSTTEAELLSLSQGAKEGQFVKRLLDELSVVLDNQRIRILCDNRQSISLLTSEIARLRTKLRHVDIHNHWLRQEVRDGRVTVEHVSTKMMIANGLTKALSRSDFNEFVRQVNLVDITNQITERRAQERQKDELDHNAIRMRMGDDE